MAFVIRSAVGRLSAVALCLVCLASLAAPGAQAKRCGKPEDDEEVLDALFDLVAGTFEKHARGEELSLEEWSMQKLYLGGYEGHCSQLHRALRKSTDSFEIVARSLMKQVLGMADELDASNKEFIYKSIESISPSLFSITGTSALSGASAGAVGLARRMVERPEVLEGVRFALIKAREGQLLVKQHEKLMGVVTSFLPGHLKVAATVMKKAPLVDADRVANPVEVQKWASRFDVSLQATMVAVEFAIDFDQWANGELSGERVMIKLTGRFAGWAAAELCAQTGAHLGEQAGHAIGQLASLADFGAAAGAAVGGALAGVACHSYASRAAQALAAKYFNVPFDQQSEQAYRALGVKPSASNSEVNKAFQGKVQQLNLENKEQFETEILHLNMHMETIRASRNKEARALMSGLTSASAKAAQGEL